MTPASSDQSPRQYRGVQAGVNSQESAAEAHAPSLHGQRGLNAPLPTDHPACATRCDAPPGRDAAENARAIASLIESVSNDVGHLLAVFNRNLNVLAEEWLSPVGAHALLSLASSGSYLRCLTDELRRASAGTESRARNRQMRLSTWWPDMASLLDAVYGDEVVVRADIPLELPCVCILPRHLTQIVFTLVRHSAHAISHADPTEYIPHEPPIARKRGEVEISARLAPHSRSVNLTVADNGAGMSHAAVTRAFEPRTTARRARGGPGLGLARVKRLVGEVGGHVHVSSVIGRGTTVAVELPTRI